MKRKTKLIFRRGLTEGQITRIGIRFYRVLWSIGPLAYLEEYRVRDHEAEKSRTWVDIVLEREFT